MLTLLCSLLFVPAPQGESRPSAPPPAERFRVDSRGWPVLRNGAPPGDAPGRSATDFEDTPAAPPGAAAGPERSPARPTRASSGSALDEVFLRIGSPAELQRLECAVARLKFHVFDHRGGEIAVREVFLESDLRVAARDRLVFPDEKLIYGRDAAAVWAEKSGMIWASLERAARGQLAVIGTLLRSPWGFADDAEWVVFPGEAADLDGVALWRVRVERKGQQDSIGPVPAGARSDRYELYCDVATREPRAIRFQHADGAGWRRVDLIGYQDFGAVRIPTRWMFRRASGQKALEIEVVRIDGQQKLPREQFQPPVR